MEKAFFQNRKWMLFFVLLIFVIFSFFIFNKLKNKELAYKNPSQNSQIDIKNKEIINNLSQKDMDSDGLKDWEEFLWGTDPNNPDSDGDGMSDQEEILLNRDPLVEGEGDQKTIPLANNSKKTQDLNNLLSQTDLLARDLFTTYVQLKKSDSLGTEEQDFLINQLIERNFNNPEEIKLSSLSDLKIKSDSSKETLEKYAQDLKKALSAVPEMRDDNFILNEALKNNNPELLQEIENNLVFYKQIINDFLKIEVPEILKNEHLALINGFEKMTFSAQQLTKAYDDPVATLIQAKKYYEYTDEIEYASATIGEFFKQNNINF